MDHRAERNPRQAPSGWLSDRASGDKFYTKVTKGKKVAKDYKVLSHESAVFQFEGVEVHQQRGLAAAQACGDVMDAAALLRLLRDECAGRVGGRARSPIKAANSRLTGRKSGRPRKEATSG